MDSLSLSSISHPFSEGRWVTDCLIMPQLHPSYRNRGKKGDRTLRAQTGLNGPDQPPSGLAMAEDAWIQVNVLCVTLSREHPAPPQLPVASLAALSLANLFWMRLSKHQGYTGSARNADGTCLCTSCISFMS